MKALLAIEAKRVSNRIRNRETKKDREEQVSIQKSIIRRDQLSARENIKEIPMRIKEAAKEGKTALRIMSITMYCGLPGVVENNLLSVWLIREYFPDNPILTEAKIISLWLLRNGFKVRIEKVIGDKYPFRNTVLERWLVAIW